MKLLTLDVGNTTLDACLWGGDRLLSFKKLRTLKELKSLSFDYALAITVRESLRKSLESLKIRVLKREEIPIKSRYESFQTLGIDRLLNAYSFSNFFQRGE